MIVVNHKADVSDFMSPELGDGGSAFVVDLYLLVKVVDGGYKK